MKEEEIFKTIVTLPLLLKVEYLRETETNQGPTWV